MTTRAAHDDSGILVRFPIRTKRRLALQGALALLVSFSAAGLVRHQLSRGSILLPVNAAAYATDGAPVVARIERTQAADRHERLDGEARFELGAAHGSVRVDEIAELNAAGRLLRADVSLTYTGEASRAPRQCELAERLTLDAVAGVLTVQRVQGRPETRRIAADLPWIYLPIRLSDGARLATPTAVSVAQRASRSGGAVRLVMDCAPDESVTADQFAVSGTGEDWVLLGDDLATFARPASGQAELVSLRLAALGLELRPAGSGPS